MGNWLTTKGPIYQSEIPNKYVTMVNQVYVGNDNVPYLIPKNLLTDNYTMPLGIDKSKRDVRPSHLHDIGCMYHQVIKINIPLEVLLEKYIYEYREGLWVCRDIPIDKLEVINIGFNKCNNLLYEAMRASDIPRPICRVYRLGVNFNLNWLFTGKHTIDLSRLYKERLYT